MLSKQAWRLLTEPRSFTATLLKARYFPLHSFKNAGLRNNPSAVWRGIITAKTLIEEGSRVKVGNGTAINVWNDPWIPEADNAYLTTPRPQELTNVTVSNLLKDEVKEWDRDLLYDLFNAEDAGRILKIPLSMRYENDSWFWIKEETCTYTVKSGYRLLCRTFNQTLVGGSGFDWLKLWAFPIPPKVKKFMWRAIQDNLPTLCNLQERHVDVASLCPVCKQAEENLEHLLYSCPFTQRCWEELRLALNIEEGMLFRHWIHKVFQKLINKEVGILCVTAWSIWSHRNAVVWRNSYQAPPMVVEGARNMLFQWQQAQDKRTSATIAQSREGSISWKKPPDGWITCNVDAATNVHINYSSFGCLIQDSAGTFIVGYGGQLQGITDSKIVEAMAFREALSWLKNRKVNNVCLELDAQLVVQAMRRQRRDNFSYFGDIIKDCLDIVKDLRSSSIYFVRRSANVAVHMIAREASSMSDSKEWSSVPSFLSDVIDSDNE